MDRTKREEYEKIAVDQVIKYAKEQGVKLRCSDFQTYNKNRKGILVIFFDTDYGNNALVDIFVSCEGRWSDQLKKAKEGFLNYANARVLKYGVRFTFSIRELDLIREKNVQANEDMEKVIRKITKLLALSDLERNPSENEAIAASLAVQKLLAKYNMSLADVTGERNSKEDIEQVVADVGTGKKWKYELSDAVADNYACKTFSHGADQIIFYGYKADVLIARRVFIYLFKVGNRLANRYVKQYKEETNWNAAGVYNSFVSGFTNGVRKELQKQCTALALVIQSEVQDSWEKFSANFRSVNRSVMALDSSAFMEGETEGKRALNAQYLE